MWHLGVFIYIKFNSLKQQNIFMYICMSKELKVLCSYPAPPLLFESQINFPLLPVNHLFSSFFNANHFFPQI